MPLPLSAGKQQTRELTPNKIIMITTIHVNYQRREVDGLWGLMEQSNGTIQYCVNQDTMEQSTITCLWDITSFILSNIQPVQHIYLIYTTQPHNEAQPLRLEQ